MNTNKLVLFRSLACLVLLAAISFGCEKLGKLTTFRIHNSTQIVVPKSSASDLNLVLQLTETNIQSNSSESFKSNNTRAELVKEVVLEKLSLTITSPDTQDFRFLKSIRLFIKAPGLNEVEIASKTDIPEDAGKTIDLNTTNVKLDEYIKKDSYTIRTEVVTRQVNSENVAINADMTFKVTADVL